MSAPKLFGLPLWKGKIKRRVAKKYLRYFRNDWFFGERAQREFAHLDIGDFINDCTGLNGRITEIRPTYRRIASGRGAVLLNIDFQTTNTGCSLCHCGVEPKLSREEIEKRKVEFARDWALDDSGEPGTAKYWYGKDTASYEKAVDYARRTIAEIESGGHVVDEDGILLEAWKEPRGF
jgi:hypothetical protein